MKEWVEKYERYVFFAAVLAGLLAVVFVYHRRAVSVSPEAMVYSGMASDLLAGRLEGRQGLVGSLKWPPLPTLLLLPFVRIPGLGTTGLGFPVLNAIVSAFTLTLLNGWWTRFGIPRMVRFPLLCLYQASPPVIAGVLTGSSAIIVLLMLVAGAYFLVHWLRTLDVRSLAYLGVLGGLACLTRYLAVGVMILAGVVVLLRVRRDRRRSFRGGTLLILLIPGTYALLLWFIANWLIMGDPIHFLRGLWLGPGLKEEITGLSVEWLLYLMPPLMLLIAYALSALRGAVSRQAAVSPKRRRHAPVSRDAAARSPIVITLVIALLVGTVGWPYVAELWPRQGRRSYFGTHSRQIERVDEIITYLARRRPEAKVFVPGYGGYQFLARSANADAFVHLMNLDLHELERRTRGQQLLFLVPGPTGLNRWEDINLRLPWLFDGYMRNTIVDGNLRMAFVLEKEWPDWRLIEAIRTEKARQ